MKIPVYDLTGKKTSTLSLKKAVFDQEPNQQLLAQAVHVHRSRIRSAAAVAKTRSQVLYTGKKMYRQKGTGNARHSSRRAPIFVGGSKAHGPNTEQTFSVKLSKKMKRAALISALSLKARQKQLIILEGLESLKKPSTKKLHTLLKTISPQARKTLLVLDQDMKQAWLSVKNIATVSPIHDGSVGPYAVLSHNYIVLAKPSISRLETRLHSVKSAVQKK